MVAFRIREGYCRIVDLVVSCRNIIEGSAAGVIDAVFFSECLSVRKSFLNFYNF